MVHESKAFGGFSAGETSDQANSMTSSNRNAAFEAYIPFQDLLNDEFFSSVFPAMFDTSGAFLCLISLEFLVHCHIN
jgi:hypothetical protein